MVEDNRRWGSEDWEYEAGRRATPRPGAQQDDADGCVGTDANSAVSVIAELDGKVRAVRLTAANDATMRALSRSAGMSDLKVALEAMRADAGLWSAAADGDGSDWKVDN